MGVYEELGVRKVINALGTATHLGGSIPDLKVMEAMKEASQSFVVMMELLEKSGEVIAKVIGAEAAMVTSGAAGALVLGAAACIMRGSGLDRFKVQPVERVGLDEEWMDLIQKLPDTSWTRNEFIIQKTHRNPYDHSFIVPGGKLVVVGNEEGSSREELESAISMKTAGIAFTALREEKGVPHRELVEIARKHDVPVIVDAAAELPPKANLNRFIREGADLVVFSGGKEIGGPNDTGILCGRRDLIRMATLQASPYRGVGRGMKVDRTQIVGLTTALRLWMEKDEKTEFDTWKEKARWMVEELKNAPRVSKAEVIVNEQKMTVYAEITLDAGVPSAADVVLDLRRGDPSIWVGLVGSDRIVMGTSTLKNEEEKIVVSRLKKNLMDD